LDGPLNSAANNIIEGAKGSTADNEMEVTTDMTLEGTTDVIA